MHTAGIKNNLKTISGFTLLELLIVIGALAILSTVTLLILNPIEYIKRTRDSSRIQDFGVLHKALDFAEFENKNLGAASTVYVSIPDPAATPGARTVCAGMGLPALPTGWSYSCVHPNDLRKVDDNGWVPVNFTQLSIGSPLNKLPIDPVNTTSTGLYYTYTTGGSFKLTSLFESEKLATNMKSDGGPDPATYEVGSNLNLANFARGLVGYWKLDNNASDSSGNGNNGTENGGMGYASGKVSQAGNFDGDDFVNITTATKIANGKFTISAWIKFNLTSPMAVYTEESTTDYQPFTWCRN